MSDDFKMRNVPRRKEGQKVPRKEGQKVPRKEGRKVPREPYSSTVRLLISGSGSGTSELLGLVPSRIGDEE